MPTNLEKSWIPYTVEPNSQSRQQSSSTLSKRSLANQFLSSTGAFSVETKKSNTSAYFALILNPPPPEKQPPTSRILSPIETYSAETKDPNPMVLFVARMRPVAAYDSTFAELVSIHGFYKKRYGEPEEYKYRGVTNQRCDLPLNQVDKRRQGIDDYTYFLQLLADADKTRLELFIVLNGWNALTTDPLTFVTLFYGRTCKITLRVFTSSPNPNAKLFHDAGVREMCRFYKGIATLKQLDQDTARAIYYFRAYNAMAFPLGHDETDALFKAYYGVDEESSSIKVEQE